MNLDLHKKYIIGYIIFIIPFIVGVVGFWVCGLKYFKKNPPPKSQN